MSKMMMVLLFVVLAGGCCGDRPSGAGSKGGAPKAARVPSMEVSASVLFADYHANEVSADAKYKGKTLAVTGTVSSIDKDFMDDVVVHFATSSPFMGIMAKLDVSQKGMAAGLTKGQQIRLVCEGGGMVVGSPALSDCAK